jgi:protocatechuate 3,4-dioxygenase beta subunit
MSLRSLAFSFLYLLFAAVTAAGQQNTSAQESIEGRTLSSDGQPLRKANLVLRPLPVFNGGRGGGGIGMASGAGGIQQPTPYAASSDASGKFSFTGLDPGRYTLTAEHAGYLNTQYGTKRTAGGVQTGNPIINLTAGQHLTEINIQLTPQAVISGKVTDEDGDPMARVRVTASRRMYALGGSRLMNQGFGTTDDTGAYQLGNLQPGRYYITFSQARMGILQGTRRAGNEASAPEMGYGTTYYPGSPDLESAVAVDVTEGQEKSGINLQMHQTPVYHIRGKVTGDLPAAQPGAGPLASRVQIEVTTPGSMMMPGMNTQMANPDGSFDVGGLTPGTWTVSALRMQGRIQILGQSTVVVSNQDVADVSLAARSGVDISGAVRIVPERANATPQNNGSAQGAAQSAPRVRQVLLQPEEMGPGSNVQPAQVQADGSFQFAGVPPLRYRVSAGIPPGGYLKSATLNGQDALRNSVDMSSGGTLNLVVSMTAAEVDGTVTGNDGQPATDAIITITPDPLQPERRDLYRQARTGSDGGFTLKSLAPGKYRVFAWEELEPGAYFDPEYMKPFESLGAPVSVDESDKKSVTVKEISKNQAADVNQRAGH